MKKRIIAAVLTAVLAVSMTACAGAEGAVPDGWYSFMLICNEGMNNDKGNAGNTIMVVSMNPETGDTRLMSFTWDTFIEYEGYDVPQRLDMPYRNGGAEEAMKVFNDNFGMDLTHFLSLNYLNLASLIDSYGGVKVDITRAERNALNGMVASKKRELQAQESSGMLTQIAIELMADEYQLNTYGPDTLLNGLQAVGYGWLQYDSVYNCCGREAAVIADLFDSLYESVAEKVLLYVNDVEKPDEESGKRIINLDGMTEEDFEFLKKELSPIFDKSYHNLSEDEIREMSLAIMKTAYRAAREGVNIFEDVNHIVLPIEAKDQNYTSIAGQQGILIDNEANIEAIRDFLYGKE